ncbi:MAG: hypothetical protein GY822_13675 [Deltaproteobacteria bacterium]|nr:hypothetical protein [Deltaproteobacteria bacterium]
MKKQFSPSEYAEKKEVHPSRITALKQRLKTKSIGKHWFIVDCAENDALFMNPQHNAKRKKQ